MKNQWDKDQITNKPDSIEQRQHRHQDTKEVYGKQKKLSGPNRPST